MDDGSKRIKSLPGGEYPGIQVEPEAYFNEQYNSKRRFCSYWHQIKESISLKPERMLEIGVGNSFVSNYLKERGLSIITLDIDKRLKPDIVGTILELPFADESFDVVGCFEVIEHLSFSDLNRALSEIFRVSKSFAVLSTIDVSRANRFNVEVPLVGEIKRLIPLPRIRKLVHNFDGQHYWEIGKAGYSLKRVVMEIQNAGFQVLRTYRVFENYHHRFFILRKGKYRGQT